MEPSPKSPATSAPAPARKHPLTKPSCWTSAPPSTSVPRSNRRSTKRFVPTDPPPSNNSTAATPRLSPDSTAPTTPTKHFVPTNPPFRPQATNINQIHLPAIRALSRMQIAPPLTLIRHRGKKVPKRQPPPVLIRISIGQNPPVPRLIRAVPIHRHHIRRNHLHLFRPIFIQIKFLPVREMARRKDPAQRDSCNRDPSGENSRGLNQCCAPVKSLCPSANLAASRSSHPECGRRTGTRAVFEIGLHAGHLLAEPVEFWSSCNRADRWQFLESQPHTGWQSKGRGGGVA